MRLGYLQEHSYIGSGTAGYRHRSGNRVYKTAPLIPSRQFARQWFTTTKVEGQAPVDLRRLEKQEAPCSLFVVADQRRLLYYLLTVSLVGCSALGFG